MGELADDPIDAAREAKARGDWDAAYRLLRQAGAERADLPVDALADLGQAAWWLGHTSETIDLTERVHERCLAEGAVERAAEHAVDLAFTWFLRGDPTLGLGWLSRARRLLDGRPACVTSGLLEYVDASLALNSHDLDTALAKASTLQDMGARYESATLNALGLTVEGIVSIHRGDLQRGFALLDEAMLPVVAERVRPEFAGDIYCRIISTSVELADVVRARSWVDTMQRWCDGFSTAAMFTGVCRVHRSQLLREAGSLDDAEREARRTCDELADINLGTVSEAYYELGEIHRLRGDADKAARWYGRAEAAGHAAEPGTSLLLLHQGRPDAALRRINAGLASFAGASSFKKAPLWEALVEIAVAAGDPDTADEAAAELERVARAYDTAGFRASSLLARAMVRLARCEFSDALAPASTACELYRSAEQPYAEACAHDLIARCHRAMGNHDAAQTQSDIASALFAKVGVGPPPRVRTTRPGGLTERELDVLRCVAAGASNREIATALSISDKTVGRHLSNILAKLDVGSRTAATAWAYEHGVHDDDVRHLL